MGYREALEAAGANVINFIESGDYQGQWIALVEYQDESFFVTGSYGSCTGCDSFQAEFGWGDNEKEDYQQRLAEFGRLYLDSSHYSLEEILATLKDSWCWETAKTIELLRAMYKEQ